MIRHPVLFILVVAALAVALHACESDTDAMTLTHAGAQWEIAFTANPENVAIQLVTECKGKVPYYAVDLVPIEGDWDHLRTRRQPTPKDARCTVVANVLRNPDGGVGDPDKDYIGESAIVVVQ